MSIQYEAHAAPGPDSEASDNQFDFMSKLPGVLRLLGTGALLVAMYTFLIKGWQNGNDVVRYFMMLGHTGVLAMIGLASGLWLKESKGARLLLTLALVSIPANFAIIGAFLFSQFGIDALAQYPAFVTWSAASPESALLTTGVALLILIPITLLGFSVLARSISKRLTVLFLLSNAALLIPIREPIVIGLIVLALAVMGMIFFHQSLRKHIATKTREGITALNLQALPLALLMGRTLWLYSADAFLILVLVIAVYLFLRQITMYIDKESSLRNFLDVVALIPAIAVLPASIMLFVELKMASTIILPLSALFSAIMIYDVAQRNQDFARIYRWIAAATVTIMVFANMWLHSSSTPSLIAIIIGLAALLLGYRNKQQGFFSVGILMMIVGLFEQLAVLVQYFDLGSWATLAVVGVLAIFSGSLIESRGQKLQTHFSQLKQTFKAWEG